MSTCVYVALDLDRTARFCVASCVQFALMDDPETEDAGGRGS